jgi:hypothetical protein
LPPMADSISSREGFMDVNFLENVRVHIPLPARIDVETGVKP